MQTAKKEAVNYQIQMQRVKSGSLLSGIQNKIRNAFVQSIMSKDNSALNALRTELENLYNRQNLIQYWRAYLQFYSSIYYLQKGDKKL